MALRSEHLSMARDALEAARRGRTWARAIFALAPSIESLTTQVAALYAPGATLDDLAAFMRDATIAMGPGEYVEFSKRWSADALREVNLRPAGPGEQLASGDPSPLKPLAGGVGAIVVVVVLVLAFLVLSQIRALTPARS